MEDPNDMDRSWVTVFFKFICFYWRGLLFLIWPCVCASVFFLGTEAKFRCLFVACVMAGYWISECIPIQVTGLIPLVLLPILAVQDTSQVCFNYMIPTNMLFMGSIFFATAFEYCGLHTRIAYCTIHMVGCSHRKLHFGLTMVTTILSMWFNNAAACAMMCPIIFAILGELEKEGIGSVNKPKNPADPDDEPPKPTNITLAYFLGTAYGSTIGGIGCLMGTITNFTYKALYETRFPDGNKIDFLSWLLFNFPPMCAIALFSWVCLEIQFMGLCCSNSAESKIVNESYAHKAVSEQLVREKRKALGSMQWNECGILWLFLLCTFLWIFRDPSFMPGWLSFYTVNVGDASPAIALTFFFAVLPATWTFLEFCSPYQSQRPTKETHALVPWKVLQTNMPWGLLFLLGGGSALAEAGRTSGMSKYLGDKMSGMSTLPPFIVLCTTSFFASLLTEITSNAAICNIISPILMDMAIAMKVHPITYSYTAAIMCSCSFLLPAGTAPNAIVADQANITALDMMKGGYLIKLFSWAIYMCLFPTYGKFFYDLDSFPDWVLNSTVEGDT